MACSKCQQLSFNSVRLKADKQDDFHSQGRKDFFNFHNHDFIRVAVAIPKVRVADPVFNSAEIIALMQQAEDANAAFVLFHGAECIGLLM